VPSPQIQQSQWDCPQRLQQYGNVLKRGAVKNVLQVVLGFIFRRILLAQAKNLCQSGHPGLYAQPSLMPVAVVASAFQTLRPGAYKAHLTA
jgi:hypothetical protein